MPEQQITLESVVRRDNLNRETEINLSSLKGGIPQSHKWQPKTSMEAFKKIKVNGRHSAILGVCRKEARPLTDRQIKDLLGLEDMNSVRPRISELIDFGLLRKARDTKDSLTNMTVRTVVIAEQQGEF